MNAEKTLDYFLKTAWQNIVNNYNQIAADFELTQAMGYVLINIHKQGTNVSQIAALIGLKSTSLSRMLNNMEKCGLLYREGDQKDKRSVKIFLTERGKEKRQVAKKVIQRFNDYLKVHLGEKEYFQLIGSLEKISQLTVAYKYSK